MTTDEEYFRAIKNVEIFLRDLMMRSKPIPKTKELRMKAYRLLKHYPSEWFTDKLEKVYYENQQK